MCIGSLSLGYGLTGSALEVVPAIIPVDRYAYVFPYLLFKGGGIYLGKQREGKVCWLFQAYYHSCCIVVEVPRLNQYILSRGICMSKLNISLRGSMG